MSRLNMKVRSLAGMSPVVKVDGKRIRCKKNSFGNYDAVVNVEDGARLTLSCWDTILSPLWLVWEMLFFAISLFGIFDFQRDKLKRAAEFEAVLHPKENGTAAVTLIRSTGEGSPAVKLECDFDAEVVKNEYFALETVKRRRTIALIIKIAIWIALIGTAIAVVAKTF